MTWVIGANDVGEIVEAAQNHPASIVPTFATSLISAPHRWVRKSIDNDDLIAPIDRVTNGLAERLSLTESILDRSTASDEVPALQDRQTAMTEQPTRPHRPR